MVKNILKSTHVRIMVLLYFFLALSASLLFYSAWRISRITDSQSMNYYNHFKYHVANDCFRQGTDLLTEAVRRYVVTMKPEYIESYFKEALENRHRDRAVATIKAMQIDPSLKDSIDKAMAASKKLMDTEYHAMHLIALKSKSETLHREIQDYPLTRAELAMTLKQREILAEELLWDENYIRTKSEILFHLSSGLEKASSQAMARHVKLGHDLMRVLSLGAISLIVLVLTICGLFFYRRYQHECIVEQQSEENARMNVRLLEERDKALKAEKAKSYFFSTVSHDIRTPLNSIIGFSEMLQLGINDPEEKAKALDAIITSGQTLLELINDVLDLSKLESGKMELHPVPTDISELVNKVANSFEVATSRTSVPILVKVEKMPFLRLDPQRIRQILFNLIGNAVKFTAKGTITVSASYKDGTFILAVTDTGCGISPEDIKKLMSPYVQIQTHDNVKGTGLGLAICKQLAIQMDGSLELKSELEKGSTFTLRIPNVEVFSDKESEAFYNEHNATRVIMTNLHADITAKNILIVDDQKLNQKILQTMLARLDIKKVKTAGNGKEALEILQQEAGKVDLVLTDMSMPVMDGAQLVRAVRKSPELAKTPVYVITADVEMQTDYKKIGFDDLLIKPITLDKLKELLAKYMNRQLVRVMGSGETKA